jgi:hypothetical protein
LCLSAQTQTARHRGFILVFWFRRRNLIFPFKVLALLEAIKWISRVGDHDRRKEGNFMIWTIRCKKCFDPIVNQDKSVEVSSESRKALMIIRSYCPRCNISTVYNFVGEIEGETYSTKTKPIRYK